MPAPQMNSVNGKRVQRAVLRAARPAWTGEAEWGSAIVRGTHHARTLFLSSCSNLTNKGGLGFVRSPARRAMSELTGEVRRRSLGLLAIECPRSVSLGRVYSTRRQELEASLSGLQTA